jgi:VIT1/CCC1 family predicted Fe2+/Mn2+ transporter
VALVEHWREEKRSAFLYRAIALSEPSPQLREMFVNLARAADQQAATWAATARAQGETLEGDYTPNSRDRIVLALVRRLGPRRMRGVLGAMKVRGMSVYRAGAHVGHAMPTSLDDFGSRHRSVGSGGALRAAVFGASDGLVSNASLILGVAGSQIEPRAVVLSGLAGLLAGAFSMAAGEWVSVRSQRELFEYQIGLERDELAEYPEQEAEELALIYQARGLPLEDARKLVHTLMSDPTRALDTLAREELGLNPDDLGSPWKAAYSSFLAFAVGAAIPLAAFAFASKSHEVATSAIISAIALFLVGCSLSLFTGRNALWSGLRQTLIGAAAGLATWSIGRWLGVEVG